MRFGDGAKDVEYLDIMFKSWTHSALVIRDGLDDSHPNIAKSPGSLLVFPCWYVVCFIRVGCGSIREVDCAEECSGEKIPCGQIAI